MTVAQNPLTPEPVVLSGQSCNVEVPQRALAIGAHPDDIDFGCGATLAKWAASGCEVHVVVCTDGSKGTWDQSTDTQQLITTRQTEQQQAAKILGATGEVGFLGWPDGELESTLVQRAQVAWWIRKLRPTVVLGHDPWKRYRLHPDHRHAGWLVTDGVVAARDPKFFTDQEYPHHRPDAILLWEADQPNHYEDVTGFEEIKYAALTAHKSQYVSTMHTGDGSNPTQFRSAVMTKLRQAGDAAGVTYAEVFTLIDDL